MAKVLDMLQLHPHSHIHAELVPATVPARTTCKHLGTKRGVGGGHSDLRGWATPLLLLVCARLLAQTHTVRVTTPATGALRRRAQARALLARQPPQPSLLQLGWLHFVLSAQSSLARLLW